MTTMGSELRPPSKRQCIIDRIATNDSKLLIAEMTVNIRRNKQYELRTRLNTTASFSKLPREVIDEIFSVVPRSPNDTGLPKRYVLGGVCKAWRTIVQTTPRLWSTISIKLNQAHFSVQKALIDTCLRRSRKQPLEIRIVIDRNVLWEPPTDVFELLVQNCFRWKTFVCLAFTGLSVALEKANSLRFPLLETMQIQQNPGSDAVLKKWKFNLPPRLEVLDITGGVSWARELEVDWSNLTSLSADIVLGSSGDRYKECIPLRILETCTSLVSLSCELITPRSINLGHVLHPTIISLPSLKKLSMTALTSVATKFMSMTKLPALTHLELEILGANGSNTPEDPTWTTGLVNWAKCSSFKLDTLMIWTNCLAHDGHLADMISHPSLSQHIKNLRIEGPNLCLSNSLITQLTVTTSLTRSGKSQRNHFPNLSWFFFSGNISFSVSTMTSVLKSRMKLESQVDSAGGSSYKDRMVNFFTGKTQNNSDHPSIRPGPEPLEINIEYHNREWFQNQNPNRMSEFYQTIEAYKRASDTKELFCLWWDGERQEEG